MAVLMLAVDCEHRALARQGHQHPQERSFCPVNARATEAQITLG
jgi:hypothetical protein